jgi:hypothetical protein
MVAADNNSIEHIVSKEMGGIPLPRVSVDPNSPRSLLLDTRRCLAEQHRTPSNRTGGTSRLTNRLYFELISIGGPVLGAFGEPFNIVRPVPATFQGLNLLAISDDASHYNKPST